MPYYRIVIWTTQRREPFTGIRQIDNYNIDTVQHIMRLKADGTYHRDLIDVEVQMISKSSTAVKEHLKALQKKREEKKNPSFDQPEVDDLNISMIRKRGKPSWKKGGEGMPLWERMGGEDPEKPTE